MQGLMMDRPLLLSGLLEHAARVHGDRELVSYTTDEPVHRGRYRGLALRARRLAAALKALGVGAGDRVAPLACSTHRHLEVFYAAAGSGAVCHTINPRLHPEQIAWILDHAEDAALFVEPAFLTQATAALAGTQRRGPLVVMTDRAAMPAPDAAPAGRPMLCYEELLGAAADDDAAPWPEFDENTAAALCYTYGTTGRPKGVLYSHRSTILHAFAVALPDVAGLCEADSVLPAAPMFHVQAWGIPYAAALTGARLVLPGARLHGAALADLIEEEGVTVALGVPTLWVGLIRFLRGEGRKLSTLKRVIVGGAACPPAMVEAFQEEFGVECRHAWGMTEMSPLGTIATLAASHQELPPAERTRLQAKQGRPVFGVEIKIVGDGGDAVAHDGRSIGEIKVRGPWVCRSYYRCDEAGTFDADGWLATGDLGSIDADGFLHITDRRKDLIKCAGEWISSVEIETIAIEHPAVMQAAAIGVPDEKWGERPLLIVVPEPGYTVCEREIRAFYETRVPKWGIPDRVVCTDSLPVSATGKVQKNVLRERYGKTASRNRP
ncbi:MAG: long-chain-fatty-acid--CoA ligase [Rhodospirillales bacterium]